MEQNTCNKCGRPMQYATEPKCNYNDCCMDEYCGCKLGHIKEVEPTCDSTAVIPSITVESVEGITNLANSFVHVNDINTTFYIDDKHRPMITWGGPVDIPGYDMENNPEGFRDQIVTDKEKNIAVIYNKHGEGFTFGIYESLNADEAINEAIITKLNEMAEDGTLENIIAHYIHAGYVAGFDNLSDLENAANLVEGSICMTLGKENYEDEKRAYYRVRDKRETDVVDGVNIVALNEYPTLVAEKIGDYFSDFNLEFYASNGLSSGFLIKFPNGKNLLFDTGLATQWDKLQELLDNHGVTKLDYLIVSHFHVDHVGNVQNICTKYDISDCKCYIGMRPDFENHAAQIEETAQAYDDTVSSFRSYGLNPIVPQNDSYIEVDDGIKLHFLNTSLQLASDYDYYSQNAEWHTDGKCNLNVFSLICEVTYNDKCVVTMTGDIEKAAEKANCNKMHKTNILIMPHHGVNRCAFKPFYETVNPDYAIFPFLRPGQTGWESGWLYPYFESYKYTQELNANMVTIAWTAPINSMFPFYFSRYNYVTPIVGASVPESKLLHVGESFAQTEFFINYLEFYEASDITLNGLISYMQPGDTLSIYWYDTYDSRYPQLLQDIKSIFPYFGADGSFEIKRMGISTSARMTFSRYGIDVHARGKIGNIHSLYGTGYIRQDFTSTDSLINVLNQLPRGSYQVHYFRDDDNISPGMGLLLDINVSYNDYNGTMQAAIYGTNRNTNPLRSVVAYSGYINTAAEGQPTYDWKALATQ